MHESEKLETRLTTWLESQGYPLEMEVARSFQTAGFRTLQSDYYADPETKTSREIDVLAFKQNTVEQLVVRLSFVVECKSSRDKPWILFTSPHLKLHDRARILQRACSEVGFPFMWSLVNRKDIADCAVFKLGDRPGYGMTQGFTSGNDVTYAAATTVAKAARAKARQASKLTPIPGPLADIVLPVVVVDGRLFEYYLTPTSERILAEIQRGILLWRNPVIEMPHTIIHVLTLGALPDFVSEAAAAASVLLESTASEAKTLIETWRREQTAARLKPKPTR